MLPLWSFQGAREHALAARLARSPLVQELVCAPGNGGTAAIAENVPVAAEDLSGLVALAVARHMDFVVVGEGGEVVGEIVTAGMESDPGDDGSRRRFIDRLKPLAGIYVPSAYRVDYGVDGLIEAVTPLADDVPAASVIAARSWAAVPTQ